jgi:hypothetical protein
VSDLPNCCAAPKVSCQLRNFTEHRPNTVTSAIINGGECGLSGSKDDSGSSRSWFEVAATSSMDCCPLVGASRLPQILTITYSYHDPICYYSMSKAVCNDSPVLVTVAFDYLSAERSSRSQPCAASAGRKVVRSSACGSGSNDGSAAERKGRRTSGETKWRHRSGRARRGGG